MSEGFTVSKGSQWGGLGSPGLQGDYMPPPRWCSGLAGTSCSCHSTSPFPPTWRVFRHSSAPPPQGEALRQPQSHLASLPPAHPTHGQLSRWLSCVEQTLYPPSCPHFPQRR